MNEFKKIILKNFDFLFLKGGFVVENEVEKDLKDFMIIVQKNDIRFRFIQDRADFFIDIGSIKEPNLWYEWHKIFFWLKQHGYLTGDFTAVNKLSVLRKELNKVLPLIEKIFNKDHYLETKEAIRSNSKVEFL